MPDIICVVFTNYHLSTYEKLAVFGGLWPVTAVVCTRLLAFALSHTQAPTSGTISPKTSGTLLLSLPSKANSGHFSVQSVCVHACACVRVCMCVCVVMLEPLLMSTSCVDNIVHLSVHYVCYIMLVQRFEPQGRHFTNFHYYHNKY